MKNKTCTFGGFSRKLILVIFLIMLSFSVFSQEIGLVLSGGGGKGAYQVGVWKAFQEYGIAQKVTAISGSSVGGLNAALFALNEMKAISMDEVLYIWQNLVPFYLVEDDALISQPGLLKIIDMLPLEKLYYSYPLVNVTCVRKRYSLLKTATNLLGKALGGGAGLYAHRFWLNFEDDATEIQKMLLATSAFPIVTSPITLKDGYEYTDGGNEIAGGDNVPIDGILDPADNGGMYNYSNKIDTIYVVYLKQKPTRRIKVKDYDKYNVVEIIPSIDLAGLFDGTCNFTPERINMLIKYGYDDTVKILREKGLYPVSDYWFK
ncbi:MAG: patatin-like phospholipase family protein [Spirochaetaceae bacterium]|nr:patatin-like phospholipase family protein [Spirochaetaceae bacterium]